MCIFTEEPSSVANTKIFVSPIGDGRQFTAYANFVQIEEKRSTAMILPYPAFNKEACVPVDMSGYPKFFEDVEQMFEIKSESSDLNFVTNSRSAPLAVFQVGSYKCTVATCFEDLSRVQADTF